MGRAQVTCGGACACSATIDAHRPEELKSITRVQRLAVHRAHQGNASDDAHATACCEVRVRVLRDSSSGGHKFKILSLLLSQPGHRDLWNPPGVGRKIALPFEQVMDQRSGA